MRGVEQTEQGSVILLRRCIVGRVPDHFGDRVIAAAVAIELRRAQRGGEFACGQNAAVFSGYAMSGSENPVWCDQRATALRGAVECQIGLGRPWVRGQGSRRRRSSAPHRPGLHSGPSLEPPQRSSIPKPDWSASSLPFRKRHPTIPIFLLFIAGNSSTHVFLAQITYRHVSHRPAEVKRYIGPGVNGGARTAGAYRRLLGLDEVHPASRPLRPRGGRLRRSWSGRRPCAGR